MREKTQENRPDLLIEQDHAVAETEASLVVMPVGCWVLPYFDELLSCINRQQLHCRSRKFEILEIDGSRLEKFDTSGAMALSEFIKGLISVPNSSAIRFKNFSPAYAALFELVSDRIEKFSHSRKSSVSGQSGIFSSIGLIAEQSLIYLRQIFSFFGIVSEAIFRIIIRPSLFRGRELVTQLEDACVKSIPVVSLVTFLIGVVVAYLMAIQIEKYGGHIFVVNGVALAMCRELSPIIVAVVMAGRSGSAYTAQIGAMRLNEEVDAITAIGLSPMHVLVIPRLLALVLSMPLLVFIGDLVGIAGGMFIAESYLGVSYSTFIDRLQTALPVKHFIVGMVKAPVFAAVIALIGCRRGLSTEMNARSVGLSTTATVVESIVLVILLNAGFAVIFAELGI